MRSCCQKWARDQSLKALWPDASILFFASAAEDQRRMVPFNLKHIIICSFRLPGQKQVILQRVKEYFWSHCQPWLCSSIKFFRSRFPTVFMYLTQNMIYICLSKIRCRSFDWGSILVYGGSAVCPIVTRVSSTGKLFI